MLNPPLPISWREIDSLIRPPLRKWAVRNPLSSPEITPLTLRHVMSTELQTYNEGPWADPSGVQGQRPWSGSPSYWDTGQLKGL